MNTLRTITHLAAVAAVALLAGCAGWQPLGGSAPGGAYPANGWAANTVPTTAPGATSGGSEVVRGQTPPGYDPYARPAQTSAGAAAPYNNANSYAVSYPPTNAGGYAQNPPASNGGQNVAPAQFNQPAPFNQNGLPPGTVAPGTLPPPPGYNGGPNFGPPPLTLPSTAQPPVGSTLGLPGNFADIDAFVQEARTGRLMFGVGVNSEAGVTGQFVIDERNFDITRIPTSFDDFVNGTAFRGAGQGFRLEALPGNQVQRYLVSFTEPYLLDSLISLNVSGFYFDRIYTDWNEQRLGGRVALGRRLTPDLSISVAGRAEQVKIFQPSFPVPELAAALGDNDLYSGQVSLTHDTRDVPFAPTEGHLIELSYEQVFGTYDYPRGEAEWSQYFLIRERPDGSGRHTLSTSVRAGFSGSQTPIFENFFAGGFSTMRGFAFRGASPTVSGVIVGGEFRLLGTVEYIFPLTADDMFKGALFVDYGTVEEKIEINSDDFRVAPGFGFRINVPMLGPAPLAFDFAFPIAREDTDQIQVFSFFFGLGR
ncbi:MAG: BamA/TamA family outer membrane protein [Pirellulaceae bacterium]